MLPKLYLYTSETIFVKTLKQGANYFILEQTAFQKVSDIQKVTTVISLHSTNIFLSYPRRTVYFLYQFYCHRKCSLISKKERAGVGVH